MKNLLNRSDNNFSPQKSVGLITLIFGCLFSATFSVAQNISNDSPINSLIAVPNKSLIFNGIRFKSLELQIRLIEENDIEIAYFQLPNSPIKPLKRYEENLYLKSINSSSIFVDIKDWDNPYGTKTPDKSLIMGGINAILEKIQQ